MSFKVKDLMIKVGPMEIHDDSTCTLVTKPTGSACADTYFLHAGRGRKELSLLKAQLRHVAGRA